MKEQQGKFLIECEAKCWCGFCGKCIQVRERYLNIWKNAWRGSTRTNICQFCLLKIFIELAPSKEQVNKIRKELVLYNLES